MKDRTALALLGAVGPSFQPGELRDLADCVMVLDCAGRVTQVSRGSIAALEVGTEAEVIGQTWSDLWAEEARAPLVEAVHRSAEGHIAKYWAPFVHADGSISQWDIRLTPVHDAASTVTSVIAVARQMATH